MMTYCASSSKRIFITSVESGPKHTSYNQCECSFVLEWSMTPFSAMLVSYEETSQSLPCIDFVATPLGFSESDRVSEV